MVVQERLGNPDGVVRYHSRHVVARWGTRIQVLEPSRPEAPPRIVYENPRAAIFDLNVSYDARMLWFSMREGYEDNWHLYEINVDGTGLRQITHGPYHDFAPAELPDGRLVFVSTRVKSFNMCAWELATALFTVARDGSGIRQLTANTLNEFSPQVLPDGRILYTRWEYVDRDVKWRQKLWTVNPDGTQVQLYHGNTIRDPAVVWQARPIPETDAVVATLRLITAGRWVRSGPSRSRTGWKHRGGLACTGSPRSIQRFWTTLGSRNGPIAIRSRLPGTGSWSPMAVARRRRTDAFESTC